MYHLCHGAINDLLYPSLIIQSIARRKILTSLRCMAMFCHKHILNVLILLPLYLQTNVNLARYALIDLKGTQNAVSESIGLPDEKSKFNFGIKQKDQIVRTKTTSFQEVGGKLEISGSVDYTQEWFKIINT